MTTDESRTMRRSKVARVIDEYGLEGMAETLSRSWQGQHEPKRSLRDLAEFFNHQILEAAMREAGTEPLQGEVENLYRLLTDDSVSASARTEAETRLARADLDVESLLGDFVSHQAVHTFLTKVENVDPPAGDDSASDAIENRTDTIQRLRSRLVAVTERSLEDLRDGGHLTVGAFDVITTVTVHCSECGRSHAVVDLLGQGGCECQRAPG